MWRDEALLLDMLLAASDAREFTAGLDLEAFKRSKLHQNAVVVTGTAIRLPHEAPFETLHQ